MKKNDLFLKKNKKHEKKCDFSISKVEHFSAKMLKKLAFFQFFWISRGKEGRRVKTGGKNPVQKKQQCPISIPRSVCPSEASRACKRGSERAIRRIER